MCLPGALDPDTDCSNGLLTRHRGLLGNVARATANPALNDSRSRPSDRFRSLSRLRFCGNADIIRISMPFCCTFSTGIPGNLIGRRDPDIHDIHIAAKMGGHGGHSGQVPGHVQSLGKGDDGRCGGDSLLDDPVVRAQDDDPPALHSVIHPAGDSGQLDGRIGELAQASGRRRQGLDVPPRRLCSLRVRAADSLQQFIQFLFRHPFPEFLLKHVHCSLYLP